MFERNKYGGSPLQIAWQANPLKVAKLLFEKDAGLYKSDPDGQTPLALQNQKRYGHWKK